MAKQIEHGEVLNTLPRIQVDRAWGEVFEGKGKVALQAVLPQFLNKCRWFGGKARSIQGVRLEDAVPLRSDATEACFAIIRVDYANGDHEFYSLPLTYASVAMAEGMMRDDRDAVVSHVRFTKNRDEGFLFDAFIDTAFRDALCKAIGRNYHAPGDGGEIVATSFPAFRRRSDSSQCTGEPSLLRTEQSNTSVTYGDAFILKWLRRPEYGINPELEMGLFLGCCMGK